MKKCHISSEHFQNARQLVHLSSLLRRFKLVTSLWVVGDVEGMVPSSKFLQIKYLQIVQCKMETWLPHLVISALNDKSISLASNNVDLRNQKAIYVPEDFSDILPFLFWQLLKSCLLTVILPTHQDIPHPTWLVIAE